MGLAIAVIIKSLADSTPFPKQKDTLNRLAKTTAERWSAEVPQLKAKGNFNDIENNQLPPIFSTDAEQFASVRVLDQDAWKQIVDWLCELNGESIPELRRDELSEKLFTTFPQALREVLKDNAAKGGQAFAGMLLLLQLSFRYPKFINRPIDKPV